MEKSNENNRVGDISTGLKILESQDCAGSIPAPGTTYLTNLTRQFADPWFWASVIASREMHLKRRHFGSGVHTGDTRSLAREYLAKGRTFGGAL